MDYIPIAQTAIWAASRCSRTFSASSRCASSCASPRQSERRPRRRRSIVSKFERSKSEPIQGVPLPQARFLNRRTLHLRTAPARVVVRPGKSATEPRDIDPTDKTRANHIVARVLKLDAEVAARQLTEVLANFEGRHRNLLEIFEARATEMEAARGGPGCLNSESASLSGASAGVRLPCGVAAGRSRPDRACGGQARCGGGECCRTRDSGRSRHGPLAHRRRRTGRPPRI